MRPEQFTDEQRLLYNELLSGPRGQGPQFFQLSDSNGVLTGPFNAMLLSPRVGTALQRLGAALRYQAGLPDPIRELVILVVASHLGSDFEWYAHEPVARHYGVPADVIATLRDKRSLRRSELAGIRPGDPGPGRPWSLSPPRSTWPTRTPSGSRPPRPAPACPR